MGLTQRQLAHLTGRRTPARISALENGWVLPSVEECAVFEHLFNRTFAEMWPNAARAVEISMYARVRGLNAHLASAEGVSERKRLRLDFVQQQLQMVVGDLFEA